MPTATPLQSEIDILREQIQGDVWAGGDPQFEAQRMAWNLTIDHQPTIIVEAASTDCVQAAVEFASKNGLKLTVQTTGHGQPRRCEGGLLLRLCRLNQVSIDANSKTASIGGGAVWGDVIGPAHAAGLAPLSGSSPGVGVVGYLVGGGYGLMLRKHGLTVDTLKSATVVLADGSVARASAEANSDLFYAIRGGGGAFGVITEVEVGLVPFAEVFGGHVAFDASLAPQVLKTWAEWTKTLPNDVTSGVVLITFPPVPFIPEFLHGRSLLVIVATVCLPAEEAEALLAPIRSLPGAEMDSFATMPYTESASIYNDPVDPLPAIGRGALLKEFGPEAVDAFFESVGPIPQSPNMMIQIRHLGGAVKDTPAQATPIGDRRQANYLAYCLGVPMPHNPADGIASHAEGVLKSLAPWELARGPLNWVGEGNLTAKDIRGVYDDASFEQLLSIKRRVDPGNVFGNAGVGIWLAEMA